MFPYFQSRLFGPFVEEDRENHFITYFDAWQYFRLVNPNTRIQGRMRETALVQTTVLRVESTSMDRIQLELPNVASTFLIVFGRSMHWKWRTGWHQWLHDRSVHHFLQQNPSFEFDTDVNGEILLVFIQLDKSLVEEQWETLWVDDSTPNRLNMPTSRYQGAVRLEPKGMDLLASLLLEETLAENDFMHDEIARVFLRWFFESLLLRRTQPSYLTKQEMDWFYLQKRQLLQRRFQHESIQTMLSKSDILSPTLFTRRLHQLYGMTVLELVLEARMAEAIRLLQDPSLPIKLIAFNCGFESTNYFTRVFHRYFQVTPRQYRKLRQ